MSLRDISEAVKKLADGVSLAERAQLSSNIIRAIEELEQRLHQMEARLANLEAHKC